MLAFRHSVRGGRLPVYEKQDARQFFEIIHSPPLAELPVRRASTSILPIYILTLFLSSALLFVIEPMFAKMVLPLLGGTPAVWATCMVFFQASLLAGYAYAHWSIRILGMRRQIILHVALLLLTALSLPVGLRAGWTPPSGGNPLGWLMGVLVLTVGLPFFAVSSTGPVLQRWFAGTGHRTSGDPYFLYAASNLGSMLALLAYPALIEPWLRLSRQCSLWSGGYCLLIALTVLCAFHAWNCVSPSPIQEKRGTPLAPRRRLRWIVLAVIPSSLLLGVTTFITTDIAAVPLLWVVPLALYLLSFILVFMRRPILSHAVCVRAFPLLALAVVLFLLGRVAQPLWMVLTLHLSAFFTACMVCHGELAKDRPPANQLTDFYLMMSVGGMLGGLFNALLAPVLFTVAAEYPIGLFLACAMCPRREMSRATPRGSRASTPWRLEWDVLVPAVTGLLAWQLPRLLPMKIQLTGGPLWMLAAGVPVVMSVSAIRRPARFACCVGAMLGAFVLAGGYRGELLAVRRSFFGIHRIVRTPDRMFNDLYHGSTVHGRQQLSTTGHPAQAQEPLTYYTRSGPIGDVFANLPSLTPNQSANVAVVGLGVGSLAAYAWPQSRLTYHEIDPIVVWAARDSGQFSFLSEAQHRGVDLRIVLGDARLTLRNAPPHGYHLLVLDAFSGDAVPAHLLTREAMGIYLEKLAAGGVLAVHISNVYLNLKPVIAALAEDSGCICYACDDVRINSSDSSAGKCHRSG